MFANLLLSTLVLVSQTPSSGAAKADRVVGSKVLWASFPIKPGSPTDFITSQMKELETVVDKIDQLKPSERRIREDRIRKIVSGILDITYLGRRALVSHWETLGKTPKGK